MNLGTFWSHPGKPVIDRIVREKLDLMCAQSESRSKTCMLYFFFLCGNWFHFSKYSACLKQISQSYNCSVSCYACWELVKFQELY